MHATIHADSRARTGARRPDARSLLRYGEGIRVDDRRPADPDPPLEELAPINGGVA